MLYAGNKTSVQIKDENFICIEQGFCLHKIIELGFRNSSFKE
jgi:hypothetical protein